MISFRRSFKYRKLITIIQLIKQQNKSNNSVVFQDYKYAFLKAKANANEDDLVLVLGSAFLIGDILKEFY